MKRFIILTMALAMSLMMYNASAQAGRQLQECLIKAKSCYLPTANIFTQPNPFNQTGNVVDDVAQWWPSNQPAISTGYYFVTNASTSDAVWRPQATEFVDTSFERARWMSILSGPRQQNPDYWTSAENTEGHTYFRNPANDNAGTPKVEYFLHASDPDLPGDWQIDSTDDAIAGPIKLGLAGGFRFNGIRYDSFYVSTNGIISLTNRRYFYDADGNRRLESGSAYDPNSMDWFATGRGRSGDGMNDNTADDYGWRHIALGNNPGNAQAGLRRRGGMALNGGTFGNVNQFKTAVISPFFGDLELSQYANSQERVDQHGQVMYYRTLENDKLHIYIINAQPIRAVNTQACGGVNNPMGLRPGNNNYISGSAQVVLDNKEDDITIIYRTFAGSAGAFCKEAAQFIFTRNTTSGVRGFARHVNHLRKVNQGVLTEYEQYTHHWISEIRRDPPYPYANYIVRYKQWTNALRVVDIQYRVRDKILDPNFGDLSFKVRVSTENVNNYELLAGEPRLGAIQPIAIIQNLTNDIMGQNGQNYVAQDLEFRAMFRIVNKASGRVIYQKETVVDSTCMALPEAQAIECSGDRDVRIRLAKITPAGRNLDVTPHTPTAEDDQATYQFPGNGSDSDYNRRHNGVRPYAFVELFFPPWSPSEFIDDHIGRLEAYIIAIPRRPNLTEIKDEWPFDDTTAVNLFVLRRMESFYDDGNEFHLIDGVPMPSVWKWVNIDAEMVSGEEVSKHPLPPRTQNQRAVFVENPPEKRWVQENINRARAFTLSSPVIKMNRVTLGGQEPAASPGGDVITSFPINMIGRRGSVLSVSVQRAQHNDNWARGWADARLIGPEPRSIFNGNIFNNYNIVNSVSQNPDELVIEYANSWVQEQVQRLSHVTNIAPAQWRRHFRRDNAPLETNVPVLRLYGGGGYAVGFLESDPDSALANPANPLINSLRANVFDDGIDFEYRKFFLAIPDTFVRMPHNTAENFRFRIRVMATLDDRLSKVRGTPSIPDDDDDFFVDNVQILFRDLEATDIEVSAVKVNWPYFRTPASQATRVPISVTLTNNTAVGAPTYFCRVEIFKNGDNRPIYCRQEAIPAHLGSTQLNKNMPSFNARQSGPGNYRAQAIIIIPGDSDKDPRNDTTYTDFVINFGDDFALDPVQNVTNNVPDLTGNNIPGRGLTLFGFNPGGGVWTWDFENFQGGALSGTGSGQLAMRFDLQNADTVKGFKAYFGTLNQSPDFISISIYDDANGIPGREILNSRIDRQRGLSDTEFDEQGRQLRVWGDYVDYLMDSELVLQPGNYWVVIAQLGQDPLHLGASSARGGMRTMNIYQMPGEPLGLGGIHLAINKEWRRPNAQGSQLLNDNRFAYENSKGSNEWVQFMPNTGNPGYPHLHHMGFTPNDGWTMTNSRGFWVPLLRPVLGNKSFSSNPLYQECDTIPVELAEFDGVVRGNRVELFWVTATEIDNKGFYVERKLDKDGEEMWSQLGWVNGRGKGNFTEETKYSFIDDKVKPNVTYNYRLRQVDVDGAFDCESSGIITKTIISDSPLSIELTSRNPFDNDVTFNVNLPKGGDVLVEVVDMFGNTVQQFLNQTVNNGGPLNFTWTAETQTGAKVVNGAYIIRATLNGQTVSEKVSVIR